MGGTSLVPPVQVVKVDGQSYEVYPLEWSTPVTLDLLSHKQVFAISSVVSKAPSANPGERDT